MARTIRELEAQLEMLHHVNQPAVCVRRVMSAGIRQDGQNLVHVFQIELSL